MKYYVATTGALFALLILAYIVRIFLEGIRVVTHPDFAISTIAAIGICIWAIFLLRRSSNRDS